ncbi:MAG: GWxTD domain-containing protein [Bacteroidota bacterium]|nr:GWxTD domain-containing protein [Bacteroidota bacterium]
MKESVKNITFITNKIRVKIILMFSSLIIILFSGCYSLQKISNQNISYIYQNDFLPLNPEYTVYHNTDSTSCLYYRINANELFYSKNIKDSVSTSLCSISLLLLPSYESKVVVDSFTVNITDTFSLKHHSIIGKLEFAAKRDFNYILEVNLIDRKRNNKKKTFITIEKTDNYSRQNFFVMKNKLIPNFSNIIIRNHNYYISYKDTSLKKLSVVCYRKDFPISIPPFSNYSSNEFSDKPDSSFTIFINKNKTFNFKVKDKGFYHIRTDSTQSVGLTLYAFDDNFPEVNSVDQLIQPIRYITSKVEFDNINMTIDKKKVIDEFWLENSGNPLRAKELIKIYYNRVKDANKLFTSYIEGWKTDRGMIYIVYGAPNIVYRSAFSEIWIYGEANNILSINFSFDKVSNPFTDNDYSLARSTFYANSWYSAVDAWRR